MRKLIICMVLALLSLSSTANASMTYGASYYQNRISYIGTGYDTDPLYLFINEVETTLDGTSGITSLILTPGTAPSSPSEGQIYYDSASNGLLLYTGSAFVTIDTAGASSLDTAYNTGSTIDVDGDAVTLTTSNTDNNRVLDLVQNDTTNNPATLLLTNTGTGTQLTFATTGTYDARGTSNLWSLTAAGAVIGTALQAGNGDLTFTEPTTNDVYLLADADAQLTIGGTSKEDIDLNFATSNTLTLSSGTGTDTIAFGSVDSLTGVGDIAFDAAASSVSLAASGDAQDLTIQVTGAHNSSLDLRSAGTGADAVKIYASAGGIDVDGTGTTMAITNTADGDADDFTIEVAGTHNSSLILQSAGTGGDAVSIITSDTDGDVKINSGDMIDIDAADDILIDLAGAAGEDILVTNTGGSITLQATEAAADAIVLYASTAVGGIDITSNADIDITTTGESGEDISITNTGGSIVITATEAATDAIVINASTAAGGIDITSQEDIDITTTGAAGEDITVSNTGGSVVISASEDATDAVNIDATAGGIDIDAVGESGQDIVITNTGGSISLVATEAATDAIVLNASTAAGGIDITSNEDIDITTTGAAGEDISITNTGGSINIRANENDAAAIVIDTAGGGGTSEAINILNDQGNGDDSIDLDSTAGGMDIDVAKSFTLTSTEGSADSILITSTNGGIDLVTTGAAAGEDIDITSSASIIATSGENVAAAILIATSGGGGTTETIEITNDQGTAASATTEHDAAIQIQGSAGGIGLLSNLNAADAIRIEADGGANETVAISSVKGTGAASIDIDSTVGGITISCNAAGKDLELDSVLGSINIEAEEDAANALLLTADGGTTTTLKIHNDTGTSVTEGAAALEILADDGGVELRSTANLAKAISLTADGGTTSSIVIFNDQGTAASATTETDASIQILSDDGGIGLTSTLNGADAIRIEANGGASETVAISSVKGTGAASIDIDSTVGGITIATNAAGKDVNIDSVLGSISIEAEEDAADAILIDADGGTTTTLRLVSTTGTSVAEDGAALQLAALAGGIGIQSDGNLDDAVVIRADGGTTAEMTIHNDQGTSESSIEMISDDGGIDITCATGKNMDLTGGQITLLSNEAAASAIALTTNTGAAETIVVTNTQGTDPAAINLTATVGAITLTTGLASSGVLVNTSTYEHKIKYFPISQGVVAATEVIVGGGTGLICTSLDAGVNEQGSTEGYAAVGDDEDILLFSIPLPDDFVDTGTQADLIMEFDISEQAAEECNIDIRIFEYDDTANITAIITDTIVAANDNTRAWKGLVTNSAGIGNETDLNGGDHLIIEITATADADDFFIYGMRLTYRVGLQATN